MRDTRGSEVVTVDEGGTRVFRYSFWDMNLGLRGALLFGLAIAAFSIAQRLLHGNTMMSAFLAALLLAGSAPLVILNLIADYLNRRRFGAVAVTEGGIRCDRVDGERVEIRWDQLSRVEPLHPGTLDFIAGRGRGGFRLVAGGASFVVFRQIRGFHALLEIVRDAARAHGVPVLAPLDRSRA